MIYGGEVGGGGVEDMPGQILIKFGMIPPFVTSFMKKITNQQIHREIIVQSRGQDFHLKKFAIGLKRIKNMKPTMPNFHR